MLSAAQIDRYSRQILVPGFGGRGQDRLLAAGVGIVGDDEVARIAALYLVAAGVGRLRVSDPLRHHLAGVNADCHLRVEAMAAAEPAGDAVWISTAEDVAAMASVWRRCRAAGVLLLWGNVQGEWAILRTDGPAEPVRRPTPPASARDASASGVWVAATLAMAAISHIVGLGLPEPGSQGGFDALAPSAAPRGATASPPPPMPAASAGSRGKNG